MTSNYLVLFHHHTIKKQQELIGMDPGPTLALHVQNMACKAHTLIIDHISLCLCYRWHNVPSTCCDTILCIFLTVPYTLFSCCWEAGHVIRVRTCYRKRGIELLLVHINFRSITVSVFTWRIILFQPMCLSLSSRLSFSPLLFLLSS